MTQTERRKAYIFDIDGTLSNAEHRMHHIKQEPRDWRAFFAEVGGDTPHQHIVDLCKTLATKHDIVFVSGRSDECRFETVNWLRAQGLDGALYMRKAGDHTDDNHLKILLLTQIVEDGYDPIMAFDDRDRVVAAWRAAGIPCAQVAPGDF